MEATERRARFRSFYKQHYARVLAYALRRVDQSAAEDLVAETFLVAWRRFDAVPEDAAPWLFGVARRLIANHRRHSGRREVASPDLHVVTSEDVEDPGEAVTERVETLRAFARLSARDQETLALVAWEGLSADRAARVVGCSVGAFWVRLHRARGRLARELEAQSPREEPIQIPEMEAEQG